MNSLHESHSQEPVVMSLPRPVHRDPNSFRRYPDDPLKELRRLRRRAARKASGYGTFGQADVEMMVEVEREIGKKLKRLAFLEKVQGDMKS